MEMYSTQQKFWKFERNSEELFRRKFEGAFPGENRPVFPMKISISFLEDLRENFCKKESVLKKFGKEFERIFWGNL